MYNLFLFCKTFRYNSSNNNVRFFCITDSQDYAVPDVTKSALKTFPQVRPTNLSQTNNLDKPPPTYDALYAASDIINSQVLNIPSLQVSQRRKLTHFIYYTE